MDRKAAIKALNDVLVLEYAAMIQYAQFSYCVKGLRRRAVTDWFFEQATDSLTHARQLGDKIVALGGIPTTEIGPIRQAPDLVGMVKLALECERRSVEAYKAALAVAADDTPLRVLLENQIQIEQESVEELEKMLGDPAQLAAGGEA